MSEKRRDSKGRILKDNEYQRKDGKYEYKYFWGNERKSVYSWTLVPTDKTPEGKRKDMCLRDKIKAIERDLQDGIDHSKANMTLNQLFDLYIDSKVNIREHTKSNYRLLWRTAVQDSKLGNMKISQIKQIHVRKFYADQAKKGSATSTIKTYHNIICPTFEMAVNSDIIRKNPAREAIKGINGTQKKKEALTVEEQKRFLNFVKESDVYNIYYPMLSLELLTGLRVGDDDDKIRLNQRKPSKYKGLSRFGPEKNLQRINKFMKERPTFYKKLIQMKENFRFYLRCFYCITKVVILQFNSEKQDRISS